jgi:hypothetical protein
MSLRDSGVPLPNDDCITNAVGCNDDNSQRESLPPEQVPRWFDLIRPEPYAAEKEGIVSEIRSQLLAHNLSDLVALYLQASSPKNLIDRFWISKFDFPYYDPDNCGANYSQEEQVKHVKPIRLVERWLFDEFSEKLRAVFWAICDAVQKTKANVLQQLYRVDRGYRLVSFHSSIYSEIIDQLVLESEESPITHE